jgi:hypothetical protein
VIALAIQLDSYHDLHMDAARNIDTQDLRQVPSALEREPANEYEQPTCLDHADYIRCMAGSAANFWMYSPMAVLTDSTPNRHQWKRMVYAIACFGNVKLAETTDSVEAMEAGERRMLAAAMAIAEAKR